MKRITIILYIAFLFFHTVHSQVSTFEIPYSQKIDIKSTNLMPELKLGAIQVEKNLEEDVSYPTPLAYCVYVDTAINIKTFGERQEITGGTIWTAKISCENAKSINIYLKHYELPEGAKLFAYSPDKKYSLGAFTNKNQSQGKTLQIADLKSNELIVEYFEPQLVDFKGKVVVGSIGLGYRDVQEIISADFIDVNCQQGDDWQLEKHGVCKITYRSGFKGYQCTGTLINTTANDGTPYFLTANHCISTETEANTAVVYFNEEKSECNGTTVVAANQTVSGSALTATSTKTDFTLLLLDETPPANYQPYYVGWNRNDVGTSRAFTIHHPSEMAKKITLENDSVTSHPFVLNWEGNNQSPPNSHWQVSFDEGITISGSSGGPLFNIKGQIVGQLHGGDESSGIDYYGKFSDSWDLGTLAINKLQPWLDPTNTGVMELNGYIPDNIKPDAHFTTKLSNVCINSPIEIVNKSVLNATSFEWEIDPPYIKYLNGTDATSKNPVVQFDSSDVYTITLLAENEFGINQQVFNDYVSAGNTIVPSYQIDKNSYCFYEFDNIKIEPSGAESYYWLTDQLDDAIQGTLDGDANFYLSLIGSIDSSLTAKVNLVGEQGNCVDTTEIQLEITYAANDDIENAFPLNFGTNGPFKNACATIQNNEPVPPVGTFCSGKDFWCDDYGNGSLVVENSLWFSFIAPLGGNVTVKTAGFDSQIAIYDAVSAQDIVSGNLNRYDILAANDDYAIYDANARIDSVIVTPNKKYWLQVDGYQGAEGIFTIILTDNLNTSSTFKRINENPVKLYPNPSHNGIFNVNYQIDTNRKNCQILVYNTNGKLLLTKILYPEEEKIDLSQLSSGMYVIYFVYEKEIHQNKILIF